MNPDLQKIENAVKAAVPDVMALKEGCVFEWTGEDFEITKFKIAVSYGTIDVFSEKRGFSIYAYPIKSVESMAHPKMMSFDDPDDYEEGDSFLTFAKILGRPITLEDVLRTINENILFKMDQNGFFQTWLQEDAEAGHGYCDEGIQWQLGVPLHLQTPEVWAFLANLLPNE